MRNTDQENPLPLRVRQLPNASTCRWGSSSTTSNTSSSMKRSSRPPKQSSRFIPVELSASSKRRLESTAKDVDRRREAKRRSASSKHRVTFEMDEKENVKTYTRRIHSRLHLDDDDIHQLWWSQDELNAIMEREQNVFEVFSQCCASYVDTVLRVWEQCQMTENDSSSGGKSSNNHGSFSSMSSSSSKVVLSSSDVEKIASAPARGMESDVIVSMIPACRDNAIRCVMETQRTLGKASYRTRSNAMRRRYRNFSRAASIFAKGIADGDAQVAAALYQKASLRQKVQ